MGDEVDIWAEARLCAAREKDKLAARLLAGSPLNLEEAAYLFDIRPGQSCHSLAGYRVTGRRGVLGPVIELPADAPLFMKLTMRGVDWLTETEDGETLYGVTVEAPADSQNAAPDNMAPIKEDGGHSPISPGAGEVGRGDGAVLSEFFEWLAEPKPDWTVDDYRQELEETFGLQITGKGRVNGVSVRDGSIVLNPRGKTAIATMLLGIFVGRAPPQQAREGTAGAVQARNLLAEGKSPLDLA